MGTGTGQDILFSQVSSERVTGVEISETFVDKARRRLPQATFIVGEVGEVLEQPDFPRFPVAVACDFLDCLPPQELLRYLRIIHEKAGKLVVINEHTASSEFYGNPVGTEENQYATPGYNSWSREQMELTANKMRSLEIDGRMITDNQALEEAQRVFNMMLASDLTPTLKDVLTRTGLRYKGYSLERTNGIPEPVQILDYISSLAASLEKALERYQLPLFGERAAELVKLSAAWEYAELVKNSLYLFYYYTILGQAIEEAGYQGSRFGRVSARNGKIVNERIIFDDLKQALKGSIRGKAPSRITSLPQNQILVNGRTLKFYTPTSNKEARLQYVVLE